jgi:hypothetical protein
VDGCKRVHLAKGLCSPHYHQAHQAETASHQCSEPGCQQPAHQTGRCHSHYWRWYRYRNANGGLTHKGEPLQWLRETVAQLLAEPTDECVLNPYGADAAGYGEVTIDGQRMRMHAAVLVLTGRERPGRGGHTRHLCGTARCINPPHITTGSPTDNAADRERHGRTPRGEQHPNARLSDIQVAQIRASTETQTTLATRYGVTQGYVSDLRSGKRRGHR